ncbi:cation-transporting ATPase [Toxoplasma gondii TgCatPRC2]|uniref:Cation-transporting ATPase n=6 Tax=Toxoplasma gondii TaxID=5811 RepID=S7UUE9_TOXGG|nr:cation-transporting ATPase [Toxoplasma gondii ME49]EPR61390.1 cation-transporting ATPase [Toxoplasma gondii GT1]KAF4642583.1 cation-transporting ATPase [Toxoplasma gondii]KFG38425.1 cation-transporting ATPase [Toxoplasma gondii FOU]KYF44564.1 cation-transporting ATPase [Toxoplasma gondii ARI]KYK64064.1 cation-transporting ATPase [Toxoplasma gondii TgCatPRC2]|eukprot:XP_018637225.1 cation-transporting ATPase [Toxoplasma gondii ME49]
MSTGAESAFRQVTEFGSNGGGTMGAIALLTGLVYSNVVCDMNLAGWNLVNGVLLLTLAFICFFELRVSPMAMQLTYKILSADCSVDELLSQGVIPASIAIGRIAIPVLLFIWTIHGVTSALYGTCSSTAPLLFGISLTEMLVQLACFVATASYMVHASGLTWAQVQANLRTLTVKLIDVFSRGATAVASALGEGIVAIHRGMKTAAEWSVDTAKRLEVFSLPHISCSETRFQDLGYPPSMYDVQMQVILQRLLKKVTLTPTYVIRLAR